MIKQMTLNIDNLPISIRAKNCLHRAKVKTIADLQALTQNETLQKRHVIGKITLSEYKQLLQGLAYQTFTFGTAAEVNKFCDKLSKANIYIKHVSFQTLTIITGGKCNG